MKSMNTPHVLIIGAGLGGLTLAQCLRKRGISFEIFERDASANARGQGWAIGLHHIEDIKAALPDDIPPLEDSFHLKPLSLPTQVTFHVGGRRLGVEDTPETPCMRANRLRLREVLSTKIPVKWGKQLERVEEDDDMATAFFADGTSAVGDLIIGADGSFSKVREHVLKRSNDDVLEPVPEGIIVGETVVSGKDFETQLQIGHTAYCIVAPGFFIFNALNRVLPDGKSAEYYFLFCERDSTVGDPKHWLMTATKEQKHHHVLKLMDAVDPKLRELVELTGVEGIKETPIVFWDATIPEFPSVGRVVLLGDAAHPMTPFRGEGGMIALKDVLELADVLSRLDKSDLPQMRRILDEYHVGAAARGVEAITLSRGAMDKSRAGGAPVVFGYELKPMEEKPLGIRISNEITA